MSRFRLTGLSALVLLVGLCGLRAVAVDKAVIDAEAQRVAVVAQVRPSVVAIFARGGQGGGSGVLISPDGYALTNFHVTSGAGQFMKCGLADGVLYDAVIVGIDPTGDVALIKLFGRDDFPHAKLGDSDTVAAGDWCFAMGNPFLLATDFQPTVTYGIVSGVHRYQYPAGTILEYTDCIQVDASINPGNSGGPLFSATGELIGINGRGSFEKRGRVNSGAGYAISINQIKFFMDHLKSGRIVDHATLGATVTTRDDGAVVVKDILEQSEAYRRGLREDDEIVSFAGRPIRSVNQFKNVLGIYPKGWRLPLVYRRDGKKQEVYVRLRGLHRESELTGKPAPRRVEPPPMPNPNEKRDKREKKPGEKKPADRPREQPMPRATPQPEAKPPAHLAKFLVAKAGYANFYFNEQEQQRVLKGLASFGDFSKEQGTWKLSGEMNQGVKFEFTLADKGLGLILDGGQKTFFQPLGENAELEDDPPGTGGLLIALHHYRLLLTGGAKPFSGFYYLGSEPLDGTGERVDVLIAELTGAESHWYFRRDTGVLAGFDFFRTGDVDPCEIRIEAVGEFSGRRLPNRLIVRHAGAEYAQLTVGEHRFVPKAAEPEKKPAAAAAPAKDGNDD